jgi:hypothetical protein
VYSGRHNEGPVFVPRVGWEALFASTPLLPLGIAIMDPARSEPCRPAMVPAHGTPGGSDPTLAVRLCQVIRPAIPFSLSRTAIPASSSPVTLRTVPLRPRTPPVSSAKVTPSP